MNGWYILEPSQTGVAHFTFFDDVSFDGLRGRTMCGRVMPTSATRVELRCEGGSYARGCSYCRKHTRFRVQAFPGESESQRRARLGV